ncbi:MAG: OFA family MFS transporter [Leptospirales bacterium]|nr:OFA family MFS transporter [Leptospirales bacterium]
MDLKTKRWVVLIVSCVVNLIIGTGYAWSIFAGPWSKFTGVEIGALGLVFAVCNAVGPVTMITGGKILDKFGPKWVVFVGGLLFGGGIALAGWQTPKGGESLFWLFFGYSIIFGLAMGLIYSCTIGNTVKWFPDKRGLVGGLTTAAYGLGSVFLALIIGGVISGEPLVNPDNVWKVFMILGVVYAVVVCSGAFFISPAPAGFVPEGWSPPAPNPNVKAPTDKTWDQMIKDPVFAVMILTILSGAFFGLMMISNANPIARYAFGYDMKAATAFAVVTLALCNTLGRVVCGWISDLLGRINTLTVALVLAVVGLSLLKVGVTGDVPTAFVLGICIVGFTFGAFMGVFPGFTADQFGPRNNGINYGIMFIGFAIAGWFGPKLVQMFTKGIIPRGALTKADLSSEQFTSLVTAYSSVFTVAIGIALFGLVMTFVFRAMTKKK